MSKCSVVGCESKARANGLCNKHLCRLRQTGTTDPGPKAHASLEERFFRLFSAMEPEGCWEWSGARTKLGYGLIWREGRAGGRMLAHRLSWAIHNKSDVENGMVVMHICDNPPCVNPAHLKLASQTENMLDMLSKNRGHKPPLHFGEKQHSAKLTEQIVREIRASSEPTRILSERYGVTMSSVQKVRRRITWKHLE